MEASKVWQHGGHRTAAEWVAARTGTTLGQAIGVLETAHRLEGLPLTRDAFCAGRLSEVQVREIAGAAVADPRAERSLLKTASTTTVRALREECRKVRAAAITDELVAYEAIRRRRYLRHWSEPDGAVRVDARLTPDAGATVIAAIDARRDVIFAEARSAGQKESSEAYAADALVDLANSGSDSRKGPRTMVHVVVDQAALARGRATRDERCEIPGVGRIPAATARALAGDAVVKTVVMDGSDVRAVSHLGRTVPARVRTALELRDPVCVVPGCDARRRLEIDHRKPLALGGKTTLDNLARMCRWHHYLKTHCGYLLGGGPGAWTWTTPSEMDGTNGVPRPPP